MDPSSSDLEFFDFKDSSDEEVKEIQAILKGPGSNGCVELPWEIPVRNNCVGALLETEGVAEEIDPISSTKSDKDVDAVVGQALHFASPQTPLSPVAQLPQPTAETFVTLPTTVGPYPNAPYFVSRTIPYLRAYPHMGVPFFACPIPGTGDANPYGQFVPMVPATVGHEKFTGRLENESNQKNRGHVDKSNRRSKKKLSSTDSYESSESADAYPESGEEQTVASPVSSVVSPTSVPLVPLPVPPSTFAVAGGTLPLHGYPPGLHTLPYSQMSGPQAPSPAMYYVPVFNHPYGGYLPSPPSAAQMVLPMNVRPEAAEVIELVADKCSKVAESDNGGKELLEDVDPLITPTSFAEPPCQETPNVQSDCETSSPKQDSDNATMQPVHPTAKIAVSEMEEVTDCNSSSESFNKSDSSSPDCSRENVMAKNCLQGTFAPEDYPQETVEVQDCLKETVTAKICVLDTVAAKNCLQETVGAKDCLQEIVVPEVSQPVTEKVKQVVRDPSRCWADLFKNPREVNGIDRQLPPPKQRHDKKSTFKKDVANGKVYSVPATDSIH